MESVCVLLKKIPESSWRQQQNQQATSEPLLIAGFLAYVLAPDTSTDECKVKWCAIGHQERTKCDRWSGFSGGAIECETAENTEECIAKIMVRPSCLRRAALLPPCPQGWASAPRITQKQGSREPRPHRGSPAPQEPRNLWACEPEGLLRACFFLVSELCGGQSELCLLREAGPQRECAWDPRCAHGKCDKVMLLCKLCCSRGHSTFAFRSAEKPKDINKKIHKK